jgi:hypothetical protein
MTPLEAATASAAAFSRTATHFMFDGATYARGGELGLEGIDFYFLGRGGALGDVDADVVSAAFVFFEPSVVRTAWDRARAVMAPQAAAAEWALAAHQWGEANLVDPGVDLVRLAELAGKVVDAASPAAAPVFAGWRRLPLPSSPASLAIHHLNGLRELRGALHGAATVTAGLTPLEAVIVKTPPLAPMFGWQEPYPDAGPLRDRWEQAEAGTDRAVAQALASLDDAERGELVELLQVVNATHP